LASDSQVLVEGQRGSSSGGILPTLLERPTVVALAVGYVGEQHHLGSSGPQFFGSVGQVDANSQVESLFRCGQRFVVPNKKGEFIFPSPTAQNIFNFAVNASDVPIKIREMWLIRLSQEARPLSRHVDRILQKIRRSRSRAQYDLFYDVQPLVHFSLSGVVTSFNLAELRLKLIVALRLFTLARSFDLRNNPPALYSQQGLYFFRLLDNMNKERFFSLSGRTLTLFSV
jgi:hypothetical protein